jgi:hypothetical protein
VILPGDVLLAPHCAVGIALCWISSGCFPGIVFCFLFCVIIVSIVTFLMMASLSFGVGFLY